MSQTVVVYIYMNDVMCTFLLVIRKDEVVQGKGEKSQGRSFVGFMAVEYLILHIW